MILPLFLDEYIFNKLKGEYAPNYEKFKLNLKHQKDDVLNYLGTYFPRSFAESYTIFDNILRNRTIISLLEKKDEITILDVGAGTGGNLSGLLLNLIEKLPPNININVIAIDGNQEALKILEKIIFQFQIKYNINVCVRCYYLIFESIKELHLQSIKFLDMEFDFIVSFKMINEIIYENRNSYYDFYDNFANLLAPNGLLLLLDVTLKIENSDFLPILLNKQSNNFIQDKKDKFLTLIPTCCSKYDNICNQICFSNDIFYISHSQAIKDLSKVTYRIIGRSSYVKSILLDIEDKGYIIGINGKENMYCFFSEQKDLIYNAYKL